MTKLAIVFGVCAAALFGGSVANAADKSVKVQATGIEQISEFSSQHRRHHRHHSRHRHVRPYADSYGYYAPRYYAPQPYYYGGGPSIGFGFGGGHFGGHHGHHYGHH